MKELLFFSIVSFIFSWFFLNYWIKLQKNKQIGKYIRKEGPSSHFSKSGTPIMGGLIFIIISLPFLFIKETFFISLSTILFGLLGLIDDLKLLRNKDYGIRPLKKIFLSFALTLILLFAYGLFFTTDYKISWGSYTLFNSRIIYFILFFCLFIAVPNAVNLTDGLDGLAGGTTLITFLTFLIYKFSYTSLQISIYIGVIIASILAFLWYNMHPAEIFMGDVGAFSLGGAISALAVTKKVELLMIFLGGIFLIESLSVFIQVFFYKWKRKRIFLMSPLHHHFELKGWKETKIVARFNIIHIIMIVGGIILWMLI
uniref:Phospho-N-acetylmuramoyl-pentapeptide-transferase n=1 Tax=Dictyoglomus thermophilum TaxID=14 RepID=A0A7C3RWX4_DICTH